MLYRNTFEFTYVSPSQVIIRRLAGGSKVLVKSQYGFDITQVDVYNDNFVIAVTTGTLICGDLTSLKISEVIFFHSLESDFMAKFGK